MSGNTEPVSAFSMYSGKRKSIEQPLTVKKKKQKYSKGNAATSRNNVTINIAEQAVKRRQLKRKRTLNIAVKNKTGIATRTGNLRIFKQHNLPAAKKMQKNSKLNEAQPANKTNSIQSTYEKSNLKKKKKKKSKVKSRAEGESSKLTFSQTKIKNSPTENNEEQRSEDTDNDADNTNKDARCDELDLNPIVTSRKLFEWLICPLKVEDFFSQNWENTPVHIKRKNSDYYECLMSTPLLDKILREQDVFFTKNVDITSYSDGKRETHNPPGRALPSVVWDYYQNDCSVRMLNPQTFIPQLHALNATLQEFFGCFVGANSYLTPPNSQGFAPHYDDIEAFILQVEGKKRWRLYKPLNESDYLARYSSKNFDQSEIGAPILDTILNAGDLLYFPRGTIHQGMTLDNTHSLHVTLSVYQRNSWCDLLEKLLPQALQRAATSDSSFRKGLPLDYLRCTGTAYDNDDSRNLIFKKQVKEMLTRLIDYINVDNAVDLLAKNHIHDFLPPVLTKDEQKCSVVEDGDVMLAKGVVKSCAGITTNTRIRLTRSHCVRLMEEDGTYKIYYSTENSKEYHEYELQFLEVEERFVSGIKSVIRSYPKFVCVSELPIDDDDEKIQIIRDLWEKGLVITDAPLGTV